MKKLIIVLLAFVTMLFGCSEDTLLNDLAKSADENALQSEIIKENKGKAVTRPFKLKGSGILTFEPSDPFDGSFYATVEGEGNGTHLGRFTISLNWFAIKVNDEPPMYSPISQVSGFMTAANGDILNTYLSGYDPIDGGYEYTFVPGTGRFESVEGKVKIYQVQEMINDLNFIYTNYGEGEITY